MSRMNTRPNNRDKHPGVVDLSPQRCTHVQKSADDGKSAEDKQAREEARKASIRHLAEVEERTMQRFDALMAQGSGPRRSTPASRTANSLVDDSGKHTWGRVMSSNTY